MFSLSGGLFLGWALGANDASNVIGSAVGSRMLRFSAAAALAALFVVVGALAQGRAGIETLSGLTPISLEQAVATSTAAAVIVTLMTVLALPVSTSQAVVGAILGIGLVNREVNLAGLTKVVICWLGTPLGGALFAVLIYRCLALVYNRADLPLLRADVLLRFGLVAVCAYGAYALGGNNVANVTAVFVGADYMDARMASLIGGLAIGLGILTFSRPVMRTVGMRLVRLDPFSALVVSLATAATVHFYSFVGVPVSTSQAVVGAVLGIGLVKGVSTVRTRTLAGVLAGWILTPLLSGALVLVLSAVFI